MKKPQSKKDIVIISSIMLAFIWLTILTGLFIWHYKGSEENYWNTNKYLKFSLFFFFNLVP